MATPRDLTVAELDGAVAESTNILTAYAGTVKKAKALAASAQKRHDHLRQILGGICDRCAAYPCMIGSKTGRIGTCAVCATSVPLMPANFHGRVDFIYTEDREIAKELSQHADSMNSMERRLASPDNGRNSPSFSNWHLEQLKSSMYTAYGREDQKTEAKTREQMMHKMALELNDANSALDRAQAAQKECKEKVDAYKRQQQQLLTRLAGGGHKRGREDDDLCCVCQSRDKTSLLIPCGHKCLCEDCATRYRRFGATCPLCRTAVQSVQRVYD